MDNKKIGDFIRELRKEKNLTQDDLAELVHISREAVSKWERGLNKPDKSCIETLTSVFNISAEELLLGRKLIDKNETSDLILNLYEDRNRTQRLIKLTIIITILIALLFLAYFFINNYNSVHVYTINYSDDNITIKNGLFITTREKIYFRLGDIDSSKEIKLLKLFYKNNNGEDKLINKTDDLNIVLFDYYGYNSYFDYKELDNILKSSYLEIEYEEDKTIIKIDYVKYFENNKFSYEKKDEILNKNDDIPKIDVEKIKSKFNNNENVYYYIEEEKEITYFEDMNIINIIIRNGDYKEEWNYFLDSDSVNYNEYKNDVEINSFSYSENDYLCLMEKCKNEEKKVEMFFNIISEILRWKNDRNQIRPIIFLLFMVLLTQKGNE